MSEPAEEVEVAAVEVPTQEAKINDAKTALLAEMQTSKLELAQLFMDRIPMVLSHETRELNKSEIEKIEEEMDRLRSVVTQLESTLKALSAGGPAATHSPSHNNGHGTSIGKQLPTIKETDVFDPEKMDIYEFYSVLEARLQSFGTPPQYWPRIFGVAVKRGACLSFVSKNILANPDMSWEDAKDALAKEFTPDDYAYRCRDKLLELRQSSMKGGDFMRQVEHLAQGAAMNLADKFFLHFLLSKQMAKHYRAALTANLGREIRNQSFLQLKEQIKFLDDQDLSHYKASSSSTGETPRTGKKGQGGGRGAAKSGNKAPCEICNKTNHTTADHKKGFKKEKDTPAAKGGPNEFPHITCNKCQEKGHYANNCPTKQSSGVSPKPNTLDVAKIQAKIRSLRADKDEAEPGSDITEAMVASALVELDQARTQP
jgi:hypothetical protein